MAGLLVAYDVLCPLVLTSANGHVGTTFKFTAWPLSSDLVITGEENIKFVQSDQNGPIWHLGAVEIGPELGLHLNICLH